MSEEFYNEVLENIKEYMQDSIDKGYNKFVYNDLGSDVKCVDVISAIDTIKDLYQKEKEKNKELENADLTTVYMNGFYDGEKKWKDKINEKIADYTEKAKIPLVNSQSIREYTFGIRAFQRLLEERN